MVRSRGGWLKVRVRVRGWGVGWEVGFGVGGWVWGWGWVVGLRILSADCPRTKKSRTKRGQKNSDQTRTGQTRTVNRGVHLFLLHHYRFALQTFICCWERTSKVSKFKREC